MKSVLLIANADAGAEDEAVVRDAASMLENAGRRVETARTDGMAALDAVVDRCGDRDIVVAGGDGTLHAVVRALSRRGRLDETAIGLIPLGTGNDLARNLGIPLDPRAAAAAFAAGRPQQMDLLVDDAGDVVVNAVHIGVGADAAKRAAEWKPRLGRAAYVLGGLAAGLKTTGVRVRVEADDRVIADGTTPLLQVGVGNGRFVGGGTALLPGADPSDGRADVIVSFALPLRRRIRYAMQLRRGAHARDDDVVVARATVARVSGEPFWCNADGELSGPHTARTWSVRPQAMTIVAPARPAER